MLLLLTLLLLLLLLLLMLELLLLLLVLMLLLRGLGLRLCRLLLLLMRCLCMRLLRGSEVLLSTRQVLDPLRRVVRLLLELLDARGERPVLRRQVAVLLRD